MELRIISPSTSHSYSILWIEARTSRGSFVIQLGHVPIILPLLPNTPITFMLSVGKEQSLLIGRGFLEVDRTMATVIMQETR